MLKKVGVKLDSNLFTTYIGTGPDLPVDAKIGDIFLQTGATMPVIKINSDESPWMPFDASWSSRSIIFNADDYTSTIFGKTMDEIFDLIKKEEELQRENKHLKEVLKIYEQMELANETNKTV